MSKLRSFAELRAVDGTMGKSRRQRMDLGRQWIGGILRGVKKMWRKGDRQRDGMTKERGKEMRGTCKASFFSPKRP